MVTQENYISADDINTIIGKINNEENSRGVGLSDIDSVSVGDYILSSKFIAMVNRNDSINNHHCYCESDEDRDPGDTTKSGTTLSLTASINDFDRGDKIIATDINKIDADINNLVDQCDCDTYACTNVADCNNVCDCNPYGCTNVADCSSVCDCNPYGCTNVSNCSTVCSCVDYCACFGYKFTECCEGYCGCVGTHCSVQCNCNPYGCTNVADCNVVCDCNPYGCTNVADCNTVCDCNKDCGCEYN